LLDESMGELPAIAASIPPQIQRVGFRRPTTQAATPDAWKLTTVTERITAIELGGTV
jgi:hypothetical protein